VLRPWWKNKTKEAKKHQRLGLVTESEV